MKSVEVDRFIDTIKKETKTKKNYYKAKHKNVR